jgi:hypothetical protein
MDFIPESLAPSSDPFGELVALGYEVADRVGASLRSLGRIRRKDLVNLGKNPI